MDVVPEHYALVEAPHRQDTRRPAVSLQLGGRATAAGPDAHQMRPAGVHQTAAGHTSSSADGARMPERGNPPGPHSRGQLKQIRQPKFPTKKRDGDMAVACEIPPKHTNNKHASLPGLGAVRLCEEQPYKHPNNRLSRAWSLRLVDATPGSWKRAEPADRIHLLYVVYDLPDAAHARAGVAAGLDRGITGPTVACRTDGETVQFVCHDTVRVPDRPARTHGVIYRSRRR